MSSRVVLNRCLLMVLLSFASLQALAGPAIQHWQTENGARVYFVEAPQLPMVDIRVVFDAGSARDGSKYGLASLTNGLLVEGAGGLSATRMAERFAELGAVVGAGSARDMAWVTLRSVTDADKLQPSIANLAMMLERPDFPQDAFERDRRRMITGLLQQQQSASTLASLAFFETVYGDHPYGHPVEGTEQSLPLLTRADAAVFHARYYVARNAVVAIVGGVDRAAAEKLAEQVVGRLPAGQRAKRIADVKPLARAVVVKQSHPSAQTHILFGQPGMSRTDPDYIALYVGNHALGGSGLVSLLSQAIREERGLTYSTYSYFSPMRVQGPFMAGLSTRNDQADEALQLLKQVIADYIESGPTDAQLQASKKNITGGFPLRIDSNKKIVEYLAMIGFYGLPLDYLDTFNDRVQAVTRAQITDALQRRLDVDTMATVIVGGAVLKTADRQ